MLTVTFDRPMQKGMSWTGGPPHLPTIDKSRKVHWKDATTCVLPVKLEPGRYYRVGVNAQSYKNFKSTDGIPTPPSVLCFTTAGAPPEIEKRLAVPKIVAMEPDNGARSVDPGLTELTVTFDVEMGEAFSWTGGGDDFPTIPEGQRPRWSRDGRTCTLPVRLTPNHNYVLGLNSVSFNNFQSKWGVPLEPVVYKFQTGN